MLKKIGLGVLALVIALIAFAALQPSHYVISRDIVIHAPAEKIWPYLNNSKNCEKWSPWLESDPSAKMVYSGPDEGVGSKTSWDAGKPLGTGSATIIESYPHERVVIQLDYHKPMTMTQKAEYLLKANGNQTTVTWKVEGENTFMGRLMCIFMNMDKMVGGMFEKGLSNLRSVVERSAK